MSRPAGAADALLPAVTRHVCAVLRDRAPSDVPPDALLLGHPRYDSLGMVELLVRLEEEFGVDIDQELEPRLLATPRALAELVAGLLPGAGSAPPA